MDKKKIILIICLIVIILASIITNIYFLKDNKETNELTIDGITTTQNKEILKDTKVDKLDITNIALLNNNNTSVFKAKVSNNTNEDIKIKRLYIIFYENEKENKMPGLINVIIKANSNTFINISSPNDLTKSTDIKYVLE